MVVSLPAQLQPGWDGMGDASEVFAYFAGQAAVFLFRVLPSPGNCLWSLGWWREQGQGQAGGQGASQGHFGSLHKIKIKAKVRLLPETRR